MDVPGRADYACTQFIFWFESVHGCCTAYLCNFLGNHIGIVTSKISFVKGGPAFLPAAAQIG